MNTQEIEEKRKIEEEVRTLFNRKNQMEAVKTRLQLGQNKVEHEFDLYDEGKVIGGITTTPWKNKTGTNNTAGQDRASTELLWLSLWGGKERRVMILTDEDMARRLSKRWQGCAFPHRIEIIHCDLEKERLETIGGL